MTREESWSDKLAHDLEYIADRSVTLYLQVIAATAWRMLKRTAGGGSAPESHTARG
jgi:lipopolysaccharide/colanic/teichoic acid biosynthesis glycosyltransferase